MKQATMTGTRPKYFKFFFLIINLFLSSYFLDFTLYQNAVSRALPVITLIESSTWQIDEYKTHTRDIARINEHYYTDKAPLSSIITLPFAYVLYCIKDLKNFPAERKIQNIIRLGSWVTGSLSFVVLLWCFFIALSTRYSLSTAATFSMLILYGSNLFIYAGAFWGHLLAAMFLTLSFIWQEKKLYFISGLILAIGICGEYTLAPIVLLYVIHFIIQFRRKNCVRPVLHFFAGCSIPILLLFAYHYAYTGNIFRPLYFYVTSLSFVQMQTYLGFSLPDLSVLYEIIFGTHRGTLFYTPVLAIFAIYGSKQIQWSSFFKKHSLIFTIISYFLVLNSSYYIWTGGWCHGPRHLIPALAVLLFYIITHLKLSPKQLRTCSLVSAIGVGLNLITKAVFQIYPDEFESPYTDYLLPTFFKGKIFPTDLFNTLFERVYLIGPLLWILFFMGAYLSFLYLDKSHTQES